MTETVIDDPWTDIRREAKLVTLPDAYLRLKAILDKQNFAMDDVANAIRQDPAITMRLLRIVNSSLYGFLKKIDTVSRAIAMLGTVQVHDLVLATSVAQSFKGMASEIMDMPRFLRRSVYCAVASRRLVDISSGCDKERVFVAGLLHDIGHLIMYRALPSLAQQVIMTAVENKKPFYLVERALFGFDYAWAGSKLMHDWSLPYSLCDITRHHVEPAMAEKHQNETILVHLGSLMTRADDGEGVFNEGPLVADPVCWKLTGVSAADCLSYVEQIKEEAVEVLTLLFPRDAI